MSNKISEKIVYFVRHGQSEANVSPTFQPPDSPLTEKGRGQAKLIAERIARLSFDALISSSFLRAKETAAFISGATGKAPEYSELFVERVKPTRINGNPRGNEEMEKIFNAWEESLYATGAKVEDGENFDEISARADKALDFLKNRPENVLVVITHGFFLKTIVARLMLGKSLTGEALKNLESRLKVENTGLSALKYKQKDGGGQWHLWIWNDHAHLG